MGGPDREPSVLAHDEATLSAGLPETELEVALRSAAEGRLERLFSAVG